MKRVEAFNTPNGPDLRTSEFDVAGALVEKVHRSDVQGLRATGISLVVLFHIWIGKVSGGVDVFFVVSAFLMTTSLLSAYENTGKINFFSFWERILIRIMPATALVLTATLLLGTLFAPRSTWEAFGLNALASLLQLENLQLMREAADYLARGTPASPFQQFWALSTQMQFYAGLPFLIFANISISKYILRTNYSIILHLFTTGSIAILSFGFAVWILSLNSSTHYFNPAARIWEFMVGALCAILVGRVALTRNVSIFLSWAGLVLVLGCGILIPASSPFPGLAALVPVAGAALILLSGSKRPEAGSANSLLSSKPLQWLASLSFSMYLWHWPLLVYMQEITGNARLGLLPGLMVIAGAILAAIFTKKMVEDPARRIVYASFFAQRPVVQRLFPFIASGLLMLPAAIFIWSWNKHFGEITNHYIASATAPASLGKLDKIDRTIPADIVAQFVAMQKYRPALYSNGCNQKPKATAITVCTFGSKDPDAYEIMLVGGSHSIQWFPAVEALATRNGFRLKTLTKSACPIDGTFIGSDVLSSAAKSCRNWAKKAVEKVIELKPDMVITTATRPGAGNVGDVIPNSFKLIWKNMADHGIAVAAIRDNPRPETYYTPSCVERNLATPEKCSMRRASHLSTPSPLTQSPPASPLVKYIDLSDYLCTAVECPAMTKGIMIYNDNSHLSVPFIQSLTSTLEHELLKVKKGTDQLRLDRLSLSPSPHSGRDFNSLGQGPIART